MIAIRDDFKNSNKQNINDWFNMTFEKMFEYKPERIIEIIDNEKIDRPITKDNYKDYLEGIKETSKRRI